MMGIRRWLSGILIPDQLGDDDEPVEEVHSKLTDTEQLSITKMDWSFVTGTHTRWGSGLTDVEIGRINLESGEKFVVERLEMSVDGGTSVSNLSFDVYDNTAGSVIDSVNANNVSKTGGESGTGNTILIRLTNGSGDSQDAMISVHGKIVEV